MREVIVIGGGLAGSEAAWQIARRGIPVALFEMRPVRMTGAHKTPLLSELVCSNSLRSKELVTGAGLLKRELEYADSLIMKAASASEVSAGSALAVDRVLFSKYVTEAIEQHRTIRVERTELVALPEETLTIVATGPLTSSSLTKEISALIGEQNLFFYDAVSPIIDAESIDYTQSYLSSRYDKGGGDYVNCPMTLEEYALFYKALLEADSVTTRDFEDVRVFEGCMPVEVMAKRGRDTLRYGPLRPVGLRDPRTGKIPYAVVQLRPENREKTAYNMVGFQTRLKWPEQQKVFRMIPGLQNAEFLRFGSIHRNTYINSPRHLRLDLSLKERGTLYFAGQITGVEGYIESTAMGLIAGINVARRFLGQEIICPPLMTAHGGLLRHITESSPEHFQPSNVHFGLMRAEEDILRIRDKRIRREKIAESALRHWADYIDKVSPL